MKFQCPLIAVQDLAKSRHFYEKLLGQRVKYDFGENVTYEGDFAIQQKDHFAQMVTLDIGAIGRESNNFELYFEEDNLDEFVEKLSQIEGIRYLHGVIEHPWAQRVIRFYDPDGHLIEVGEDMSTVARRFLSRGMSVEAVAERIQHPIEFVLQSMENKGV